MEQIESEIRRVLLDHQKICASVRSEEATIDSLSKEIGLIGDRGCESELGDLGRQRMHNLLSYQSTLIARAASRTELLRVLHDDLLVLFLRRKELRQSDGLSGLGIDVVPNLSPSSGLSIGDENNERRLNESAMPAFVDIMRMSDGQTYLEEVTTEDLQLPLGLKIMQNNVSDDLCLTSEDNGEYGDFQYDNNILDDIAMSVLDPDSNIMSIFGETMENPDLPSAEIEAYRTLASRLAVDFDEFGNPTGPNAGAFKRSINSYVCHFFPIRFKQIGDVPVEDYKAVLNVLTERYNFDPNTSYTRKKISSCYRQHKYKLLVQVKKDLERGIEPQKPSYVKKEDWDAFVVKTKDEEFDRISKKNKASRSHQGALSRNGSPTSLRRRKLVSVARTLEVQPGHLL
ncbi:unnamed protein product [Spirodela intermedia]|uniref:Uncharacterized protein n=1 Tax=Spirodela intermedia TaxID=51605 RepID=A0A7I8IUX2_SPIIN|nr:unnamed protein product [Spirodela intermedia]CAA6661559.1 unnamed protein product [Spirodela intermedia]